jgi:hypothetical protein
LGGKLRGEPPDLVNRHDGNTKRTWAVRRVRGPDTGGWGIGGAAVAVSGLDHRAVPGQDPRPGFFQPYFGDIPPPAAVAVVAVVGLLSLGYLRSRGWFAIYRPSLQGVVVAVTVATLFGIAVVALELTHLIREPADMNVPLPYALLFYPAIGFVVEVLFKALPLALLLGASDSLSRKLNVFGWTASSRFVWPCIMLVALLEPIYQLNAERGPFSVAQALVAGHVLPSILLSCMSFVATTSSRCTRSGWSTT